MTAFGGPPANATVVDGGHYFSELYAFSHDERGFEVKVEGMSSGVFRIRAGEGKTATAFYGHDNYSFGETQTNPESGAFATITANAVFNEINARRVEGSIFEFEAVEAGQFRMYDSDGRLVARDRGSLDHHVMFDTEGDDVPGGNFVEDLGADVHGPHPGLDDFCGLITPLIGPRAVARGPGRRPSRSANGARWLSAQGDCASGLVAVGRRSVPAPLRVPSTQQSAARLIERARGLDAKAGSISAHGVSRSQATAASCPAGSRAPHATH